MLNELKPCPFCGSTKLKLVKKATNGIGELTMFEVRKAPEYIERNKAKEALTGWDTDPTDEEIEYTLDKIPAADVAEVKRGEWEEHDKYVCNSDDEPVAKIGVVFICSECGRQEPQKEPYCHCGAKMDGATRRWW